MLERSIFLVVLPGPFCLGSFASSLLSLGSLPLLELKSISFWQEVGAFKYGYDNGIMQAHDKNTQSKNTGKMG